MMKQATGASRLDEMHALLQGLTAELQDVFDVHFVGATVAQEVARHAGARALFVLSDSDGQHFDAWLAEPGGAPEQLRWTREEAAVGPLFALRRPTLLEKLAQPAADVLASRFWLLTRQTALVAPLPPADRQYGVAEAALLILLDPDPDGFLTEDSLPEVTRLASVFLDRATLRETVDRQSLEFVVISDVSRALSSTLDVQEIYQLLRGPIRQTLAVEALSIGLVEPVTYDIVFVGSLMGPLFQNLPPVRVKRGQGIAGWVAEHQEPVLINDTYSDRRFFSGVDRKSGFRTRSMMCIPLQVEGRTIGVLQAINRQYGRFTDHDMDLLRAFGGPLAAAIENASLHQDIVAVKRRVDTLLESLPEGVAFITPGGIITQANSGLASLLAVEPEALVERPLAEALLLRRTDLPGFLQEVMGAGDEPVQVAAEVTRPSGQRVPVLLSGTPVRDDSGNTAEAIIHLADLTQIEEVERMRDDLFQVVIHELRTPLATVLMYARLLREGKARGEKATRFLGVIVRETDRLQHLVRQVLDLVRLEATELHRSPEPVDLNRVFDETLPPLAEQALQKGLLFRQRIEPDLPPVVGSEEVYRIILINLLDNAIKFTPSGTVQVTAKQDEGTLLVEVSDDGIGIPAEALPHMFKRFYRTQAAVERGIAGTGLGLYLVKEYLDTFGGRIAVRNGTVRGTTFALHLPIAQM